MWNSPYDEMPDDGDTVWIRVISVFGQITKATYDKPNQQFATADTLLIIPAYYVSRWKEL